MGRPPKPDGAIAQMGLRLTLRERQQITSLQRRLHLRSGADVLRLALAELFECPDAANSARLPAAPDLGWLVRNREPPTLALIDALARVAGACDALRREIKGAGDDDE